MKQAILITSYKDIHQIVELINFFDENFSFYIHVDKKSNLDLSPLKNILNKSISVSSKYYVNWGGNNHLKAILFLAAQALLDKENKVFHLISGQDFPAKPLSYFHSGYDFSKDYLDFTKMPNPLWISENGGMDRIEYYNLYDKYDAKNKWGHIIIKQLCTFQKVIKRKRPYALDLPSLYSGSTWWSLTRETLEYVMEYTSTKPQLLNRMNHTFCSEELYFQTIIMNSYLTKNIVNDNLRYIDWTKGEGGSPAFLSSSDFEDIILSNKLFARKFEYAEVLKWKDFIKNQSHLSDV